MFEIGKVYNFNTKSPTFLGAAILHAKLRSIVDATTARVFAPIDQTYAQIYPTLPVGSPANVNDSIYYVFEGLNKNTFVMSEHWIVESSIELIESVSVTVEIPESSLSDLDKIRHALTAAGIVGFTIKTR